jgi:hypothetical protein
LPGASWKSQDEIDQFSPVTRAKRRLDMDQKSNGKRIRLSIKLPSVALQHFIEKALRDDDFFESAVENPLHALKQSGLNLDLPAFNPRDIANFLGALAGVRELIRKKQLKDVTFENIFGRSAEIFGTTLLQETHKGMWVQFDKNAVMDKNMLASFKQNFETLQEALQDSLQAVLQSARMTNLQEIRQHSFVKNLALREAGVLAQVRLEMDMAGKAEAMSEKSVGYSTHFDNNQGTYHGTESGIHRYSDTSFGGLSLIEEILNGPMINPVDLAALTATLEAYAVVMEQME